MEAGLLGMISSHHVRTVAPRPRDVRHRDGRVFPEERWWRRLLAADLQELNVSEGFASSSVSNASVQPIWVYMSSANYTFSDDALTKLINSTK
jgi:hypothetical protein